MTSRSAQEDHAAINCGQHASLSAATKLQNERTHMTLSISAAAVDPAGQAATTVTACPSCFSARTCDTAYTPLPLNVLLLYSYVIKRIESMLQMCILRAVRGATGGSGAYLAVALIECRPYVRVWLGVR